MGEKQVFAIACMDSDGGIGRDGGIPWRLPSDLEIFMQETMGCCLLSGGSTWDSLPYKPLNGRSHVVVGRRERAPAERTVFTDDWDHALELALGLSDRVAVIGGQECWTNLLHRCDEIRLSVIHAKWGCDRFFPAVRPGSTSNLLINTEDGGIVYHRVLIKPPAGGFVLGAGSMKYVS